MQKLLVVAERIQHTIRICGAVTRDIVHTYGVPHTTVLIMPIVFHSTTNEPLLLTHKRPPNKRVCPNTFDICGGHVEFDESLLPNGLQTQTSVWEDHAIIEEVILNTAIREANEEIKIEGFQFGEKGLHRFGEIGSFECETHTPSARNVEFSTLYAAVIPKTVAAFPEQSTAINLQDSVSRNGQKMEVFDLEKKFWTFDELMVGYGQDAGHFADGIGRILERMKTEPEMLQDFEKFLRFFGQTT